MFCLGINSNYVDGENEKNTKSMLDTMIALSHLIINLITLCYMSTGLNRK